MREFVTEKVKQIKPSGIRKFFDVVSEMPDAISLGVGEPDFDTPWHIRDAGIKSLKAGKTFYTSNAGLMELREEICRYTEEKMHVSYDPKSEVFISVGGSEAIDIAFRATLDIGDEVIIPEPAFVSYVPCARLAGAVPVTIPLKAENEFRLTPEELEAAITPKSKILLLSYPNNPTGAIMEKADLEALCPIIEKYDLLVVSDEIYSELSYKSAHVSIASLPGMRERTIVINGFSKAFAMTGWRMGIAAGPKDVIFHMNKIHQFTTMSAGTTSQYAALEALTSPVRDEEIAVMREEYDARRTLMVEGFRKMGLSVAEPEGAFYVFPDIRKTGLTSEEFCNRLLQEQKVAVIPGNAFGTCGEGFVRCSYAYSQDVIRACLEKIAEFVAQF